ncbi:MAG TPA: hypothetical protein VKX33_09060 [Cyclobacteriaceae bacterium]|nr:hypothetical protein [Cyclobacteriaceae bacterium]
MKKNFWPKIALLVILAILFVVKGIPLLINYYLNANAEEIVSDMITRTNDFGGHEVQFGNIRVDYDYRGTFLHLSDVKIQPGETITDVNQIKFNLTLDQASLTGFSWTDFFFHNSIHLDSAVIANLTIESITPPLDSLTIKKETRSDRQGEDYDEISIDRIRVNKASFENRDSYTDSTRLAIVDLFVSGDDFVLSKADLEDPDALFQVSNVEGYMDQAVVHMNDFRNAIYTKNFSFNTTDEKAEIAQIRMVNKLEPYDYAQQFRYETDWIELENGSLIFDQLDFLSYLRDGSLSAAKLQVQDMRLVIFRDKRKPDDMERRPLMIHEVLRELPIPLDIQEVEITDGYVSYEERPENDAPRTGQIFFDDINATIHGMTNSTERLTESDEMILKAKGKLIGEGAINLEVTYFLNDTTGRFLMKGSLGAMNLSGLNKIIEPSTKVALKDGRINSLFFNIVADDIEGTGEVIVQYQNLEIEILDKNFGRDQTVFQRIGSFLANKLVIKSQNPDRKGELRKGVVYYPRDQHKFIFKYWWELVLSGLKSTITGDDEQDLRRKAAKS